MSVGAADAAKPQGRYRAGSGDTREEIITVSEQLFRQIGYRKTTIADIAAELGMSPANVYRFFKSKAAINEAVAERVLGEIVDALKAVADGAALTPTERLRELLLAWARQSETRLTANKRMYDMVEVAMTENWNVCLRYKAQAGAVIGRLIEEGAASGEFAAPDAAAAARCVVAGMVHFVDPAIMSREYDGPELTPGEMVSFLIAALKGDQAGR